ncbi:MAG: hypothetical protein IJT62_04290 [Oscillospiraceae bacterium]|nr:hypothetical protein [Oscillospiraceae bacterium]
MAKIVSSVQEKIFTLKKWGGLNENPDGDTKLKNGEAANMINWKITRDGNLKIRPGETVKMGLCQTYTLLTAGTEETVLIDTGTPSTLVMYPTATAGADGSITLSGASVSVTPENASNYADYFWRGGKYKYWKFVSCEHTDAGFVWTFKAVKTISSSLNPNVAGLWCGRVQGKEYILAACDGKLWKLCEDGTWAKSEIGTVDTTATVHIFGYSGNAYIMDGKKYRMWDGTTLSEPDGYIPVVSVSTAPAGGGTQLEQVNKLNAKRRVWFSPDGTATTFQLPEDDLEAIGTVKDRTDGTVITPQSTDTASGTVTFDTPPAAGSNTIEVEYETKTSFRSQVEKMRFSELYNGAQDTRVFIYGDGSNQVFYSGLDNDGNPRADYFPDLNVANIGTANTPVTALLRHYSRLIAFKSDSAYSITYSTITLEDGTVTAGFYITPVNRAIGCSGMGQTALVQNSPRTLFGQDCYEWKNNSSYSSNLSIDERQARVISQRVYATLAGFNAAESVLHDDDYNQEFYIAYGEKALVHNYAADAWYYYTGFDAKCFLSYDGKLYFGTSKGELRYLDETEHSDAGELIHAYWESGSMDFGADYRRKYSAQMWVGLVPVEDSEVVVTVQTDKKSVYTEKVVQRKMASFANMNFADFSFATNYKPFMQRLKIKAKKFTYYKLIFKSDSDDTSATIVAVDLRVRFNGYVK